MIWPRERLTAGLYRCIVFVVSALFFYFTGLLGDALRQTVIANYVPFAKLLVEAYDALRGQNKITVKTLLGSVTIEGDGSMQGKVILKKIKEANIL